MQYVHISSSLIDILPVPAATAARPVVRGQDSRSELLPRVHRQVLETAERMFFGGLIVGLVSMAYGLSTLVHF